VVHIGAWLGGDVAGRVIGVEEIVFCAEERAVP
jgi:hypothetical protein